MQRGELPRRWRRPGPARSAEISRDTPGAVVAPTRPRGPEGRLWAALSLVLAAIVVGAMAVPFSPRDLAHSSGTFRPGPGTSGPPALAKPKDLNFTFVSNFENGSLAGWQKVKGATPTIGSSVNYSGEPALRSVASSTTPQIETDADGFVRGNTGWALEAAIRATGTSAGYFGLGVPGHQFGLVVGVQDGKVVAGGNLSNLTTLEAVPTHTAYPAGWVYLTAGWSSSADQFLVFVDGAASLPSLPTTRTRSARPRSRSKRPAARSITPTSWSRPTTSISTSRGSRT